jgi:hypothetical protein
MNIELYVEPRKVMTWAQFKKEKPPYSIALDGFVDERTMRDEKGPYANFDHHSKVDRYSTRSTSEQVHFEINTGLFDTFQKEGIPTANLFVNDPDEDTCLAVWLLKNPERVMDHAEPSINRLVYCEDRLDCSGGAYPFGALKDIRRQMAWIFEPYNRARFDGKLHSMDAGGMETIIEAVGSRITAHTLGKGKELGLEGQYEKIGGGPNWAMTKERGSSSRMAMFLDGVKAYVAMVADKGDGSFVYTIGRLAVWTPFDIPFIYRALNEAEGDIITPENRWGGSNTIGGSPRATGSRLPPEELQRIINEALESRRR